MSELGSCGRNSVVSPSASAGASPNPIRSIHATSSRDERSFIACNHYGQDMTYLAPIDLPSAVSKLIELAGEPTRGVATRPPRLIRLLSAEAAMFVRVEVAACGAV
jgi:hypothetical protein